jgi:hypothetical protein
VRSHRGFADKMKDVMTKFDRKPNSERTIIPENLNKWFPERSLLRLVLETVPTVELPATVNRSKGGRILRSEMMLTLLTYCYASGIYASEDIVQAILRDRTVRYICAHNYPTWEDIRLFRRHRREQVEECLRKVYQRAWATKFDEGEASFEGVNWFEEVLQADINRIVDRKLDLAITLDRVYLED